jgi:L-threonylcarbamoyladenylate synthase
LSKRTRYLRVNPRRPSPPAIGLAASIIRRGGLVAFPTETVYGLGANALSSKAVQAIFQAKGRPPDNPLIVHLGYRHQVREIVSAVPPAAELLVRRFWPGPLTLVLPSSGRVAKEVSAGLDTVAVRMPRHPVALALLRISRLPIAAPSANRSGRPSPTVGRHVLQDLRGRVDLILEAGYTEVGVESTVLDLTVQPPVLLRPGGITVEEIEEVIGDVRLDPSIYLLPSPDFLPRSPGMKYRHYAPRAPLFLVKGELGKIVERIVSLAQEARRSGQRVAILASDETAPLYQDRIQPEVLQSLGTRADPARAAAHLYASLKVCDRYGVDLILAEAWPEDGLGLALMNRLRKAAGYREILA